MSVFQDQLFTRLQFGPEVQFCVLFFDFKQYKTNVSDLKVEGTLCKGDSISVQKYKFPEFLGYRIFTGR